MNNLAEQIGQLIKHIDNIIPVLIVDDWKEASAELSALTKELEVILRKVVTNKAEIMDINKLMECLKRALQAMEFEDTIQLADIWKYEIRQELTMSLEKVESQ